MTTYFENIFIEFYVFFFIFLPCMLIFVEIKNYLLFDP